MTSRQLADARRYKQGDCVGQFRLTLLAPYLSLEARMDESMDFPCYGRLRTPFEEMAAPWAGINWNLNKSVPSPWS
jgi:hypothetical protein